MKTIIATTDFSKESRAAVNYAARLALSTKCELILLHATFIPVVSDSFIDVSVTLDEIEKNDHQKMDELVKHVRSKQGPALRVKGIVEVGLLGELLKERVGKHHDMMVVMGMKHVDKFSEVVFGSLATNLAGELNCPVLIVPPDARFRPWKKVAFAFDQKEIPTDTGMAILKELTDMYLPKMHFVHVMDSPYAPKDTSSIEKIEKFIGGVSQRHFLKDVPGETVEVMQDWLRRFKCNAVVMVARKHNVLWRMFHESHTKQMAFHSPVPVLVISEKH